MDNAANDRCKVCGTCYHGRLSNKVAHESTRKHQEAVLLAATLDACRENQQPQHIFDLWQQQAQATAAGVAAEVPPAHGPQLAAARADAGPPADGFDNDAMDAATADSDDGDNAVPAEIDALLQHPEQFYPFEDFDTAYLVMALRGCIHTVPRDFLRALWYFFKLKQFAVPPLDNILSVNLDFVCPPPEEIVLPDGRSFYYNRLTKTIPLLSANPEVSAYIARYPQRTHDGVVKQIYQGKKFLDSVFLCTPMVRTEHGDFFMCDVAQLDGTPSAVQLMSFFMQMENDQAGHLLARCKLLDLLPPQQLGGRQRVRLTSQPVLEVDVSRLRLLNDVEISLDFRDDNDDLLPLCEQDLRTLLTRHPIRDRAQGRIVVPWHLTLFMDDSKADLTKKRKPMESAFFAVSALPADRNRAHSNIHHLATSTKLKVADMMETIAEDIQQLSQGIEAFDAHLQTDVLIVGTLVVNFGDNKAQATTANHGGSRSRHFCFKCDVRSGEASIHLGAARTDEAVRAAIQQDAAARRRLGIRTPTLTAFQRLVPGYRIGQDEAIELLHTVLLGNVKHVTEKVMKLATQDEKTIIKAFFADDLVWSGFYRKLQGDATKHHKSFLGKDFEIVVQVFVFAFDFAALQGTHVAVAKELAHLSKLLFMSSTSEDKQASVQQRTDRFLHRVAATFPELLDRLKTHMLLHAVEDEKRFGPAVHLTTQRFECLNGVARLSATHSDKHNVSLAIGRDMNRREALRHLLDRGSFLSKDNGLRTCAAAGFKQLLMMPALRRILYQDDTHLDHLQPLDADATELEQLNDKHPGDVWSARWTATKKRQIFNLWDFIDPVDLNHELMALNAAPNALGQNLQVYSYRAGQAQDSPYNLSSFILYRAQNGETCAGRVNAIVQLCDATGVPVVYQDKFVVCQELKQVLPMTTYLDCPVFIQRDTKRLVPVMQVIKAASVIHWCSKPDLKCSINNERIVHNNANRSFLLNIFKFDVTFPFL